MERAEEWEEELAQVGLIGRSRKGKIGNVMDAVNIGIGSLQAESGVAGAAVGEVGGLERCVYLDEEEGIWKSHHCNWTHQMGSPDVVHDQEYHRGEMNVNTLSPQGSGFGLQIKGVESTDEIGSIEFWSVSEKSLGNDKAVVAVGNLDTGFPIVDNNNSHKNLKAESRLSSHSLSSPVQDRTNRHANVSFICKNKLEVEEIYFEKVLEASEEDHESGIANLEPVQDRTDGDAHVRFAHRNKPEVEEIDLQKVLEEQNTHDLYCPNCNSCITKRVILRKRKRRIRDSQYDATKREKIEQIQSGWDTSRDDIPNNDPSPRSEPDVFRCLSCFSLFIPTVTGFKFRIFGDRNDTENLQDPQQRPATNSNWISAIFEPIKGKRAGDQEDDKLQHVEEEPVGPLNSSQYLDRTVAYQKSDSSMPGLKLSGYMLPTKTESGDGGKPDVAVERNHAEENRDTVSSVPGVSVLGESYIRSAEQVEDSAGKEEKNVLGNDTVQGVKRDMVESLSPSPYFGGTLVNEENDNVSSKKEAWISYDLHINIGEPMEDLERKPLNNASINPISSKTEALFRQTQVDIRANLEGRSKKESPGYGMIQAVDEGTVGRLVSNLKERATAVSSSLEVPSRRAPTDSVASEISPHTVIQIYVDEPRRTHEWDVLKSIIYGGLIESITSLGVVSSAAGADATTLNIVALGLANLIGGLFVIAHSLWELKIDQYGSTAQEGGTDRYQEVLGLRDNFRLHAIVTVLSYILFGLIPPVTYGFSFLESDNKDYKLIAAAAASLVCIVLLSIGKAYTQKAPKAYIKTVLYYVFIGLTASGISYAVGNLMKMLLERLGWFKLSEVSPVPPSSTIETRWMVSARASY